MFQSADQKFDEARLAEEISCQSAPSAPGHLGKEPTQMDPQVEQDKTDPDQHKPISRIARSRPAQKRVGQPVARLDAEAFAVTLPTPLGCPVQVDRHKQQPFGAPLLAAGALSRGENATDHHLGGELLAAPAGESVGSAIAPVALTQGARAAFFPANRTDNQSRLLLPLHIRIDRDRSKTLVEIQTTDLPTAQSQAAPQLGDHLDGLILRQHEVDRERHPLSVDEVAGGDTIKARRAVLRFAAHPQSFFLLRLAMVIPKDS